MPHDTLPLQTRRRTLADGQARTAGRAAHPGDIVGVHGIVANECYHDAVGHLLHRAAQHLDGPHGALPFAAPSRVFVEHEHSRASPPPPLSVTQSTFSITLFLARLRLYLPCPFLQNRHEPRASDPVSIRVHVGSKIKHTFPRALV